MASQTLRLPSCTPVIRKPTPPTSPEGGEDSLKSLILQGFGNSCKGQQKNEDITIIFSETHSWLITWGHFSPSSTPPPSPPPSPQRWWSEPEAWVSLPILFWSKRGEERHLKQSQLQDSPKKHSRVSASDSALGPNFIEGPFSCLS